MTFPRRLVGLTPAPALGIALAVALTVTLAAAGVSAAPAEDPATTRVMSYNIRVNVPTDNPTWEERRPHMARQIAFYDPDLLGVQEAQPVMVDYLAEQLPAYDRYGVGRDDGRIGESTTVFWKRDRYELVRTHTFWCSPTPDTPSKGWDAAYPRTVTQIVLRDREDGGRLLDVRNTHFDHVGVVAREQCAALVAAMAPVEVDGVRAEVILMGDFNTGPATPPYQRILETGLRDARVLSPVTFGPAGTFNAFDIAKDNDGVAIDHVFISPGFAVERFGVPTDSFGGRVISDHFPLVVDVIPATPDGGR